MYTANGEEVRGVTSLAGEIYVLRWRERDQVEVYDINNYRLQRCLSVPNARGFIDMTSCKHYLCVYIGDDNEKCVHRLDAQGAVTRWTANDKPAGLSVNAANNVLVTCSFGHKIKEYSSHGELLRELALPDDVLNPLQAIETRSGQFIVCHGLNDDPVHRVCMMSADGRHIVYSHGGHQDSDTGQYDMPFHLSDLTVNDNEFVFVSDKNSCRLTLLSPTLQYVRQVVSPNQLNGKPLRLYLDTQRRQLYVAVNKWTSKAGRVAVFNV